MFDNAAPFADLIDTDADLDDYSPEDSALLDPGSDGLIAETYGKPTDILMEMARQREAGASLAEIRRNTAMTGQFAVTDRILENATEQGRRFHEWRETGRITERPKRYAGLDVAPCATCGTRWLAHRLIDGECGDCQAFAHVF